MGERTATAAIAVRSRRRASVLAPPRVSKGCEVGALTTVTPAPFSKWDLERFIYGDPALNSTQRFVAIQVLKTLDNRFRPRESGLMSQALIGYRVRRWRETVNRALRHLVALGYFRTSWVSVNRPTAQGIKGVTRVMCELGPVLRKLVEKNTSNGHVSAGKAHGVTLSHPSPTPPGDPGTVGGPVIANSADRKSGASEISAQFKRKTLADWPRLAGRQRTPVPAAFADLAALQAAALERDLELGLEAYLELSDDEYEARIADKRRRADQALRAELAGRNQPRRRPRSRR